MLIHFMPSNNIEIFAGFKDPRKFRPRTSSGNWGGTDKLTTSEEIEYKKRMGYD